MVQQVEKINLEVSAASGSVLHSSGSTERDVSVIVTIFDRVSMIMEP